MNSHPNFVGYDAIEGKPRLAPPREEPVSGGFKWPISCTSLQATLGGSRIRTGHFSGEAEIIKVVSRLYGLLSKPATLDELQDAVLRISKAERKRLRASNYAKAVPERLRA